MMKVIKVVLAGLAVVALCPAASAHEKPGAATQHNALPAAARPAAVVVDAFHAALKLGNATGAAALLADDALIFEAGAAERSKAEYLAAHLPADIEFAQATTSAVGERTGGANGALAWIASKGRTTGTFRGKPINSRTTETIILRRAGARWQIVHVHWSSGRAD